MANPDFGADVSTYPTLDPQFLPLTGIEGLAQRLVRRLTTEPGTLAYAPDEGIDVRSRLSMGLGAQQVSELGQAIESQVLRDEQVDSVVVIVTPNEAAESLSIRLELTTAEGPFSLVLAADKLTVAILALD